MFIPVFHNDVYVDRIPHRVSAEQGECAVFNPTYSTVHSCSPDKTCVSQETGDMTFAHGCAIPWNDNTFE